MAKQEYKILEFHGGTNNKFDPRDIADNQNTFSALSVRNPGRLTKEGDAKNLYDKTDINGATIADITTASGGFEKGYGLFSFSHDYSMESTPTEVDTDFVVINDDVGIDIYDANQTSDEWQNDKFKLGSRTGTVKPESSEVVQPEVVQPPTRGTYAAPFQSRIGNSTIDLTNEANQKRMKSEYDEWWNFGKKRGFLGIPYVSNEFKGERDKLKDKWYRKYHGMSLEEFETARQEDLKKNGGFYPGSMDQ